MKVSHVSRGPLISQKIYCSANQLLNSEILSYWMIKWYHHGEPYASPDSSP